MKKIFVFLLVLIFLQAEVTGTINVGNPPENNIEENISNITNNSTTVNKEKFHITQFIAFLAVFAAVIIFLIWFKKRINKNLA